MNHSDQQYKILLSHHSFSKITLKQSVLYSLSSLSPSFDFQILFSVFMLNMRHLVSSQTRFITIPTLLISLCFEINSTCELVYSSFLIASTVLSTLTCHIPWNLLSSSTGETYFLSLYINQYQILIILQIYRQNHCLFKHNFGFQNQNFYLKMNKLLVLLGNQIYIRQMNQQKKLKLIINSLRERELIKFYQVYADYFLIDLRKTIKKISFNCFESTLEYRGKIINGYGKNCNQALASSISNFMEIHIENESFHSNIREAIKKYSQLHNSESNYSEKVKTQPDNGGQKKVGTISKTIQNSLRHKENIMKSAKTIKQDIYQSLNHANIQLKPHISTKNNQLQKKSSHQMLGQIIHTKNDDLSSILTRTKQLQQKLVAAESENEYLKNRLRQKQIEKQINNSQHLSSNSKLLKNIQDIKIVQKQACLNDISNKFNNTCEAGNEQQPKIRSFSLSNSANNSAFNSKGASKIKIPKLNLVVLPNYHGKSNKSLNQSLLQNYQKKMKGV